MNQELQNDMLKLVRYKVLFVKRDYEVAFPEREELVSENMDGAAYTSWKIAEFMQEIGRGQIVAPRRWLEKSYPPLEHVRNGQLIGIPDEDKKYFRVYFEVLAQYIREYREQQVKVLEEIRDASEEGDLLRKATPNNSFNRTRN